MCKHILNAQVSVRAVCCKAWFDCPKCHEETQNHPLKKTNEIVLACKKCKKVFRKDLTSEMDESDEYCPHCDNHYVIDAKVKQPKGGPALVVVETDKPIDEREKQNTPFKPILLNRNILDDY